MLYFLNLGSNLITLLVVRNWLLVGALLSLFYSSLVIASGVLTVYDVFPQSAQDSEGRYVVEEVSQAKFYFKYASNSDGDFDGYSHLFVNDSLEPIEKDIPLQWVSNANDVFWIEIQTPDFGTYDFTLVVTSSLWSEAEGNPAAYIEATLDFSVIADVDTDDDGILDTFDEDDDNDGLTDIEEQEEFGTDSLIVDTDGDGLTDGEEQQLETDPNDVDTDDDGLEDGYEQNEFGTDPNDVDTDDDGIQDGRESSVGGDPLSEDTDGDGLNDSEELSEGTTVDGTDTDGDGISDGDEIAQGSDPLDPNSPGSTSSSSSSGGGGGGSVYVAVAEETDSTEEDSAKSSSSGSSSGGSGGGSSSIIVEEEEVLADLDLFSAEKSTEITPPPPSDPVTESAPPEEFLDSFSEEVETQLSLVNEGVADGITLFFDAEETLPEVQLRSALTDSLSEKVKKQLLFNGLSLSFDTEETLPEINLNSALTFRQVMIGDPAMSPWFLLMVILLMSRRKLRLSVDIRVKTRT